MVTAQYRVSIGMIQHQNVFQHARKADQITSRIRLLVIHVQIRKEVGTLKRWLAKTVLNQLNFMTQ